MLSEKGEARTKNFTSNVRLGETANICMLDKTANICKVQPPNTSNGKYLLSYCKDYYKL